MQVSFVNKTYFTKRMLVDLLATFELGTQTLQVTCSNACSYIRSAKLEARLNHKVKIKHWPQ